MAQILHDTLDNPIFDTARAVPNKQQMIELLNYFAAGGRCLYWQNQEKTMLKTIIFFKNFLKKRPKS